MIRIEWKENDAGFYYYSPKDKTWCFLGKWGSIEAARKYAFFIGLDPQVDIAEFQDKPAEMTETRATLPRPTLYVYRVDTMIPDSDWNNNPVRKFINVLAPNPEVARIAIQQILHQDEPYTGEIKERTFTSNQIKILSTRCMPFVDNTNVYYVLNDSCLQWRKVNSSIVLVFE